MPHTTVMSICLFTGMVSVDVAVATECDMSIYLSLNKVLGALSHEKPVNFLSNLRILSFMMFCQNLNPRWKYTCSHVTAFKTLLTFWYTSWLIGIRILPDYNPRYVGSIILYVNKLHPRKLTWIPKMMVCQRLAPLKHGHFWSSHLLVVVCLKVRCN